MIYFAHLRSLLLLYNLLVAIKNKMLILLNIKENIGNNKNSKLARLDFWPPLVSLYTYCKRVSVSAAEASRRAPGWRSHRKKKQWGTESGRRWRRFLLVALGCFPGLFTRGKDEWELLWKINKSLFFLCPSLVFNSSFPGGVLCDPRSPAYGVGGRDLL